MDMAERQQQFGVRAMHCQQPIFMRFSSRVRIAHADLLVLATCEIVYPRALCAPYACFDSKGNFFFTGGAADVLRRDAKTGKVSTWIR